MQTFPTTNLLVYYFHLTVLLLADPPPHGLLSAVERNTRAGDTYVYSRLAKMPAVRHTTCHYQASKSMELSPASVMIWVSTEVHFLRIVSRADLTELHISCSVKRQFRLYFLIKTPHPCSKGVTDYRNLSGIPPPVL